MAPFTVATFNIRHGVGTDGILDLERTAAAIRATQASVIALQELDQGMERSGDLDQPRVLEELTGLAVAFFPTLEVASGRYGIALAWRRDLGLPDLTNHPLPRVAGEESRAAIVARWPDFVVLATHLARQHAARQRQTRALVALARAQPLPVLLMGDLNQTRRHLALLLDAGFVLPRRSPGTFPPRIFRRAPRLLGATRWLGPAVDHIVGTDGVDVAYRRLVVTTASDHLPLVAEAEPRPPRERSDRVR